MPATQDQSHTSFADQLENNTAYMLTDGTRTEKLAIAIGEGGTTCFVTDGERRMVIEYKPVDEPHAYRSLGVWVADGPDSAYMDANAYSNNASFEMLKTIIGNAMEIIIGAGSFKIEEAIGAVGYIFNEIPQIIEKFNNPRDLMALDSSGVKRLENTKGLQMEAMLGREALSQKESTQPEKDEAAGKSPEPTTEAGAAADTALTATGGALKGSSARSGR